MKPTLTVPPTAASASEQPRAQRRRTRLRLDWRTVLVITLVLIGGLIMIGPFAWAVSTSLKPRGAMLVLPPELLPREPTLDAYRQVISRFPFFRVFLNSVFVAVAVTFGQLVICSMSGYAFARLKFFGRDTLFVLYIATLMVPFAVIVTPLFIIVSAMGWTDSYVGLIVPGIFSVFGTFFMRQFFLSIPRELEEAATIDGAGTIATFFRIIVPMSGPAFATLGVLAFMGTWNSFLWPLLIISQRAMMTLPVALSTLQGIYPGQTQWNIVMASTVLATIPTLIVFMLAQRWIIEGVAGSGVKG